MPLLLKKEKNNNIILVWRISESLEELVKLCDKTDSSHLKNKKRKKEFLACRILLSCFNKNLRISYSENGSPNLNNHQHVSISHSGDLACMIIAEKEIGVDIEKISEKTLKMKEKFINSHHLRLYKEECTVIWCIKEAVFKFHKIGNLDFKKDIFVPKFKAKDSGEMNVKFKKIVLKSYYFKIGDYYLSYVCK